MGNRLLVVIQALAKLRLVSNRKSIVNGCEAAANLSAAPAATDDNDDDFDDNL